MIQPYATLSEVATGLRKDVAARQVEAARLASIDPPTKDAAAFKRLLARVVELNRIEQAMVRQIAAGKPVKFPGQLFSRFNIAKARVRNLAGQIGLPTCARASSA